MIAHIITHPIYIFLIVQNTEFIVFHRIFSPIIYIVCTRFNRNIFVVLYVLLEILIFCYCFPLQDTKPIVSEIARQIDIANEYIHFRHLETQEKKQSEKKYNFWFSK